MLTPRCSSAEEAGYYLATYKQFEHKPADMIKERVDKDYRSVLRTALTSISRVNKTDVETLRTSFGVRPSRLPSLLFAANLIVSNTTRLTELRGDLARVHTATAKPARVRTG